MKKSPFKDYISAKVFPLFCSICQMEANQCTFYSKIGAKLNSFPSFLFVCADVFLNITETLNTLQYVAVHTYPSYFPFFYTNESISFKVPLICTQPELFSSISSCSLSLSVCVCTYVCLHVCVRPLKLSKVSALQIRQEA